MMNISARNTLAGTVTKVIKGAVNAEVDLTLDGGDKVVAIITNGSVDHLGLKEGTRAYAILKASWVILGKGMDGKKISARNVLPGTVSKVHEGAVNNEVVLKLSGGSEIDGHHHQGKQPRDGVERGRCGLTRSSRRTA